MPRATELAAVAGVGPKLAEKIVRARQEFDAAAELALCRRHGRALGCARRPGVPLRSENIPDPPESPVRQGAARAARPACDCARRLAALHSLRRPDGRAAGRRRWRGPGFTVVSGLARGIDAAAHRGAIKAGGRSIAVLANGLASIYPPEHEDLARAVAEAGALVSEMPMRQGPLGRLVHPAEPHHLGALAGRRGRRGDPAQRLALDRGPRRRAESRGLRRSRSRSTACRAGAAIA